MRQPSFAMQGSREHARGITVWPFIITLLLLIVFVFLWFGEKGTAEKELERAKKAEAERDAQSTRVGVLEAWAADAARVIGYETKAELGTSHPDLKQLEPALNPETAGTPLKALKDAAVVNTVKNLFTPKSGAEAPREVKLPVLSDAFKQKIAAARDAFPAALGAMPDDPDDTEGMKKWTEDKARYDEQFAKYQQMLTELSATSEWREYKSVIGAGVLYDPDRTEIVAWNYWVKPPVATVTVQEFLPMPAQIVKAISLDFTERMNALLSDIVGLRKQIDELKLTNSNADPAKPGLVEQLEAKQKELAETTTKLQAEAAAARAELEKLRVSETTAQQALAKEREDRKSETMTLQQKLNAEENARLAAKEILDLKVARDEPDGRILAADNNTRVVYTNLGSADRAYAGLKLRVSYMARGAIRTTKGEILITKVLDRHYSQARIVSALEPISQGDMLSNPFFDVSKSVHVYLAGDLKKYPKATAITRLKAMGVVIDDAVSAATDFIVVPESISVKPTPDAAAGGDAAAAPAAGQPTEFDRLQSLARTFGATLIDEKVLEAWLDY